MVGDKKYCNLKTRKTSKRECTKQSSVSLVCSTVCPTRNIDSANGPLISSIILSSEVYFSSASMSNILAFFRYSRSYHSPKRNFDFSWLKSGALSSPLLDPTSRSVRGMTLLQCFTNTQILIIFSMVGVCYWVMMGLAWDADSNSCVD